MDPIDLLIVGAGPAGLAAAIRAKQQARQAGVELSVVVIDKAAAPGLHALSGATFEPACLDELLDGWRKMRHPFTEHLAPVERDEMYFLTPRRAYRIPHVVVPRRMSHVGDLVISVSRLVGFLTEQAESAGAEVYHGYSARTLIVEDGVVRGVRLAEVGLDCDGAPKTNHRPAEEIRATVTILGDGGRGALSTQYAERFGRGVNPQVYSLGIKEIVQFAERSPLGEKRVIHTLGYPNRPSVFGGGFLYALGEKTVAAGLILGLDWQYGDLNPRLEFEAFRAHPFVAGLLEGGSTVATGAKTIPEGGWHAMPRLAAPGAMVVGDASGSVNVEKFKGIHYAIYSGIAAADAAVEALAGGASQPVPDLLQPYRARLEARGLLADMSHARNYRQVFRAGLFGGMPLSLVQSRIPRRIRMHPDTRSLRPGARLNRPDPGRMDGATFVALTGATHREDEPSHVSIVNPAACASCETDYARACTHFCPGQVYRWSGSEVVVSPSNCLHCMTCTVKCPNDAIRWIPPEGGEGPRYRLM